MQLKDVIHYYIGCDCVNSWFPLDHEQYNKGWTLTAIDTTSHNPYKLETHYEDTWTDSVKPILRHYKSLSWDEIKYVEALMNKLQYGPNIVWEKTPQYFVWLINNHIDLFGLIESGEALDAETLKQS